MITLREVALESGVNLSTASRSLSGSYGVHPSTRKKVLEVAQRLNYRPNRVARVLATGRSNSIGLIISDIRNPYFAEVARGAEDAAFESGSDLILCNTDLNAEKQLRYVDSLLEKQVDGIIMNSAAPLDKSQLERLAEFNVPIVLLNKTAKSRNISTVFADNYEGGRLAARYLIGLGHTKAVHLTGVRNHGNLKERARGFLSEFAAGGLSAPQVHHGLHTEAGGYDLGIKILADRANVSAVFTANDVMAFGFIRAAVKLGVKIPKDVSVIGFDDVSIAEIVTPPLTTISQPIYEVGHSAVELLLKLISQKDEPRGSEHRVLSVRLVERASCGPPCKK